MGRRVVTLVGFVLAAAAAVATPASAVPACSASGDALSMRAGDTRLLTLSCPDPDGGTASPEIAMPFAHAVMVPHSVSPPATRTYKVTADADYAGPDTLTFFAQTLSGPSPAASVTIEIKPAAANGAPVCTILGRPRPLEVLSSGRTSVFDLRCNDPDNDPYLVEAGTPPAGGIVGPSPLGVDPYPNAMRWATYTPRDGFSGTDRFTLRARDDRGAFSEVAVEITVAAPKPKDPGPLQLTIGTVPRLRAALSAGIPVRVSSPTAGMARVRLTLAGPTAKRLRLSTGTAVVVATGRGSVPAGAARVVTARFTRAARSALRRSRRVRLEGQVSVGAKSATRTVTLTR